MTRLFPTTARRKLYELITMRVDLYRIPLVFEVDLALGNEDVLLTMAARGNLQGVEAM